MSDHLLLFTVGPAQSFIAQARKTQDLYTGSRLLSDQIINCRRLLTTHIGVDKIEFIFPQLADDGKASSTNRVVAIVRGLSSEDLQQTMNRAVAEIRDQFAALSEDLFTTLLGKQDSWPSGDATYPSVWQAFGDQLADLLEIHFVAEPLTDDYAAVYRHLNQLIGGLKTTRTFAQHAAPAGRKGSISGIRNALFFNADQRPRFLENGLRLAPDTGQGFLLSTGEALDAVGFLKRTYPDGRLADFPSTAGLASLAVRRRHKDAFETYRESVLDILDIDPYYNAQLYYEDNLRDDYIGRQYPRKRNVWLARKEEVMTAYYQLRGKLENDKLHKYYALVLFDGDNMGKWLSGGKLPDDTDLKSFHVAFSECLVRAARKAKAYVDDVAFARGKTVYAGGDDFMAFLSLESLFDTLQWLHDNFEQQVSVPLRGAGYLPQDKVLTISMGVAIVHYKYPLDAALAEVRSAESTAKQNGRNRFALSIVRGSGNITRLDYPWALRGEGGEVATLHLFQQLLDCLSALGGGSSDNSGSFIRTLRAEVARLDLTDSSRHLEEIIFAELGRLVRRAHRTAAVSTQEALLAIITQLFEQLSASGEAHTLETRVHHLLDLLLSVDFLRRHTNPAQTTESAAL